MEPRIVTYVLTALAGLVVVLTRVRLGGSDHEGAGRLSIAGGLLNLHTVSGVMGLAGWAAALAIEDERVAYAGLGLLWVTAFAGVLLLIRWLPARGRHSSGPVADSWGEGPGLSVLAHIGMLVGVSLFTAFLVLGEIP